MKKALKITGIVLGSLLGLVLVAVFTACYLVFTPKRLTPIVNQVADSLLLCDHRLDEVNLTFIRTFPDFGVEVRGLYVINPVEGAQSDTVLAVPELVAGVDLMKAIKGDVVIHKFALNDVEANIFIGADGTTNFDVLNLPKDTTQEEDTTASSWQLKSLHWDEALTVNARRLSFLDLKDSLEASTDNLQVTVAETGKGARLDLLTRNVCAAKGSLRVAQGLLMTIALPVDVEDEDYRKLWLNGMKVSVNEFEAGIDGTLAVPETWTGGIYDCDLNLATNDWRISSVLALLPEQYRSLVPKEIEADGDVRIAGHVYGRYDSISMPLADINLQLKNAAGHYDKKVLPYDFQAIAADIDVHADLNRKAGTTATINRLYARTGDTYATVKGTATEILKNGSGFELDNPLCTAVADIQLSLPDADPWLPQEGGTSRVKGTMKGQVSVTTRLQDVLNRRYNRVGLAGNLDIRDLDLLYADSTMARSEHLTLDFTAPRKAVKDRNTLSADCKIGMSDLHADVLPMLLNADIKEGTLTAAVELDTKDTTRIPTLEADFAMSHLKADMDTIHAVAANVKGKAQITGSHRNKSVPKMQVRFASETLDAAMGGGLRARTGHIDIEANALYNKKAENVLLQWNPRLHFDLEQGRAEIAALGMPVDIPQICFDYSNRCCQIDTSRIVLGNSDFSLAGEVNNVGHWLRKEADLIGNLRFTSDHTDVNELMALINRLNNDSVAETQTGDGEQAEKPLAKADTISKEEQSEPFMVPEHVDLTLLTVIRSADAFGQHLKNLKGQVYVRDGKLILEEMGFICEAAKLQLTAMYRTPRRNHIYVGLDYHMVDIDLQQLIAMIPQLDTLVPMLREFRGGAQFHLAAETYVNDKYDIKPSTLRGACSIEGKNLVVLDNATFSKISKILLFSPKTQNVIDTLSTQIVMYKDQVTVYPFCIGIDNYLAALGGNHYLDMSFNYHVSLLKPFYIGVDVGGTIDDLKIRPAKCRYAKDFRPIIRRDTETRSAELRKIVSSSLKRNLRIQSDQDAPKQEEENNPQQQ